jgi:hypothetical protein
LTTRGPKSVGVFVVRPKRLVLGARDLEHARLVGGDRRSGERQRQNCCEQLSHAVSQ